jgi:GWxTD domain-containing protein
MARRMVRFTSALVLAMFCSSTLAFADQYSKWLNEDVRWIITNQERTRFLTLENDKARDEFIKQFWERRNPIPGGQDNPFKEEHYRRIVFANEHFASNTPGDETDRGHVYIVYGPPDEIKRQQASSETGSPSEIWYYRHLDNKAEVSFEFVDDCRCGDYKLKK